MIKAEIYRNLATVSDDTIMDTFTHPYKSDNYEFMYDGIMWRGIDSGDIVPKSDEAIDRMIYKILSKIENK
jgi:hypothetical protein